MFCYVFVVFSGRTKVQTQVQVAPVERVAVEAISEAQLPAKPLEDRPAALVELPQGQDAKTLVSLKRRFWRLAFAFSAFGRKKSRILLEFS